MSKKINRRIYGLKFRLSKMKFRVSTTLIAFSLIAFTAFIVGGGLYDIFDNPPAIIGGQGGYIAVRGLFEDQTILESLLSMLFTLVIFSGILISYKSSEVIYNSRRATTRLMFGIFLILIGLSACFYLLNLKQFVLRTYGF